MKIKNKQTEVPQSLAMNDKDYMNKLLCTLKEMVKNYAVVLTEASNDSLYKEYKKMFDEYLKLARETYEIMFQNGWYELETAEEKKINTKFTMLETELASLVSEDDENEDEEE
ncbi:MAG: spore coat protein [Firmicutes bacterium]|nr:spore coat protein [Bacillota bacterium]